MRGLADPMHGQLSSVVTSLPIAMTASLFPLQYKTHTTSFTVSLLCLPVPSHPRLCIFLFSSKKLLSLMPLTKSFLKHDVSVLKIFFVTFMTLNCLVPVRVFTTDFIRMCPVETTIYIVDSLSPGMHSTLNGCPSGGHQWKVDSLISLQFKRHGAS